MEKKTNRWLDVQVVIASIAMVASLALWNLFASASRTIGSQAAAGSQPAAGSPLLSSLPQGTRLLLGGSAPQAPSVQRSAPAPVTVTSSSRP